MPINLGVDNVLAEDPFGPVTIGSPSRQIDRARAHGWWGIRYARKLRFLIATPVHVVARTGGSAELESEAVSRSR
jgi:hypothetical protein